MATSEALLKVKVFAPYQTFFEGTAVSVSAANETGSFDVLHNHANFFSLLQSGNVVVDTGFNVVTIYIESGILRVRDNVLTLFVNV